MKKTEIRKVKKRLSVITEALDDAIEKVHEHYDISCTKGCSHCCRQVVTTTVVEALLIIDWINANPHRKNWYVTKILPNVKEQFLYAQDAQTTCDKWFDDMVPCVFLDEEGLCSIYEARPLMCRKMLVVTPPEYCAPPGGQKVGAIGFGDFMEVLTREENRLSRHLDVTAQHAPLPVALHWASIAYFGGPIELKKALKGTVYENDLEAAIFWVKKFGDPEQFSDELRAELDKRETKANEASSSV